MLHVSRAFETFEATINEAVLKGCFRSSPAAIPGRALAGGDISYFFALSRVFDIIRALEGMNFEGKTFFDVSGSCGCRALAAGLLYPWTEVPLVLVVSCAPYTCAFPFHPPQHQLLRVHTQAFDLRA